jgi:hypothetical protein
MQEVLSWLCRSRSRLPMRNQHSATRVQSQAVWGMLYRLRRARTVLPVREQSCTWMCSLSMRFLLQRMLCAPAGNGTAGILLVWKQSGV